jgi:hypothetical protein
MEHPSFCCGTDIVRLIYTHRFCMVRITFPLVTAEL